MKDFRTKLFPVLAALFAIALTAAATDYADKKNWACCEADKPGCDFDIFYIPPTLFCDPLNPRMNIRRDTELRRRIARFSARQCATVAPRARIFSPFVRMLDYSYISLGVCSPGGWRRFRPLIPTVDDAREAFRYYLKHFNHGRPYVVFGHSQGAMVLYQVIRREPAATSRRGFVAAYLIGMPHLTTEEIAADMAPRGIRPASRADDVGVVIGWNSQCPNVGNVFFTKHGTYCINPLNWRTDATPARANEHHGALIYDRREGRNVIVKNFCGARIDPEFGALVCDAPPEGRYMTRGFAGSGVLHMYDVWFFAVNIRENIELRVKKWREEYGR